MENRVNDAVKLFEEGFACSQAVFAAFSDRYGVDKNTALKIASGFGGGIARKQEVSGAVSGAIMLIGCRDGKTDSNDQIAQKKTYENVESFCQKFVERNNSITCSKILGCDMPTAKERGLFGTLCTKCVRDAAEIVSEILE